MAETETETARDRLKSRRTLVSQVLVAALVSVAYAEPVDTIHSAVHQGISVRNLGMFAVFFLTVLRFAIGDVLHLENEELTEPGGERKWFWDLTFIVGEFIALIFMGNVSSLQASEQAKVTFFDLLAVLYLMDLLWLSTSALLHWIGGKALESAGKPPRGSRAFFAAFRRTHPQFYPGWAALNTSLGLLLLALGLLGHHGRPPSDLKLWVIAAANVGAFIMDVYVLNYTLAEKDLAHVSAA